MKRMLILAAIFCGSSVAGLLLAGLVVPGVGVGVQGFIVAVVVFTLAQSLLTPLVTKLAAKFSPPLVGGVGLISTALALLVATSFSGGLVINGVGAWVLATLVVWVVTALGSWLLPLWLLKKGVKKARQN
ncbi:MAG: phage holin family protein [Propionicimonas sp.]|uniref:phage holin family protein n=1 Tax=Propionicimonas sp. TaxID=1955623 RepID=UPI003D0C27FF